MSVDKKRETLDRTITDNMKSSANLGFYPSKQISRKTLLADENEDVGNVLAELTGDFIDGFIEIIREIFATRNCGQKSCLRPCVSRELGHFRDNFVNFEKRLPAISLGNRLASDQSIALLERRIFMYPSYRSHKHAST